MKQILILLFFSNDMGAMPNYQSMVFFLNNFKIKMSVL